MILHYLIIFLNIIFNPQQNDKTKMAVAVCFKVHYNKVNLICNNVLLI